MEYLTLSYNTLKKIIKEGGYSNILLNEIDLDNKPIVTQIVLGTIENFYEVEYILKKFSKTEPKTDIKILLYMAIYMIRHMNIPAYAVVNESVNISKTLKGGHLSGYVNAVLKKISSENIKIPENDEQIKYNLPKWIIEEVKLDFPKDYKKVLSSKGTNNLHIRLSKSYKEEEFLNKVKSAVKTETGFFVTQSDTIRSLFKQGKLTFQSLTSTLVVKEMGDVNKKSVLDMCAAPGGKSVYLSELGANVTANDIHPHRIRLINDYAKRMNVSLKTEVSDGTIYKEDYKDKFDIILIDAPCSGVGVISKRPDIIFNRTVESILELNTIQLKLLSNASKYVKAGGRIIYSTCSYLKSENSYLIEKALKENENLSNIKTIEFLPDNEGVDGFYIASLKRNY